MTKYTNPLNPEKVDAWRTLWLSKYAGRWPHTRDGYAPAPKLVPPARPAAAPHCPRCRRPVSLRPWASVCSDCMAADRKPSRA